MIARELIPGELHMLDKGERVAACAHCGLLMFVYGDHWTQDWCPPCRKLRMIEQAWYVRSGVCLG